MVICSPLLGGDVGQPFPGRQSDREPALRGRQAEQFDKISRSKSALLGRGREDQRQGRSKTGNSGMGRVTVRM